MKQNRILIAGEGGQGIQALAMILTKSAAKSGVQVTYLPNFGVEQRGGVSLAFVQISDLMISFPKFQKADIVVVLAERAIPRIERYFHENTILVFDNSLISEEKLSEYKLEKIAIPASKVAKEKLIPKSFNVIILGSLFAELGLRPKIGDVQVEEYFRDKYREHPELRHFNKKAFEIGYETMRSLLRR